MKILRLILGDQLNAQHSWLARKNPDITYLLAEMRQETDYVRHHVQKVVAFFDAMRNFAALLEEGGHKVIYLKIDDPENDQELSRILQSQIEKTRAEKLEYQLPDEYRLDQQLGAICKGLGIPSEAFDTEHFYTGRYDLKEFTRNNNSLVMENFYRLMRKKHSILLKNGEPAGGKWNFDASNRKKWSGSPPVPPFNFPGKDVRPIFKAIRESGIKTIGNIDPENFNWPTSRRESLEVLNFFCGKLLRHFGDYQDAMHSRERFLFHSRLSFAMNAKMLSPSEVVETAISYFMEHPDEVEISQIEGFVRQILGWREYMRGVYWMEMPEYSNLNKLENRNPLPEFYWTGNTRMECLKQTIGQSLDEAYAHHIQRLMVAGNFALLAQTDPAEVDQWYLGIYIDAIEWVELPNTRGMSQFADGGIVGTKAYISSANYINKMSNYCGDCYYSPTKKTGDGSCPFNTLYWNFLDAKKEHFKNNPRMSLMMSLLEKKEEKEMALIRARARSIIEDPQKY